MTTREDLVHRYFEFLSASNISAIVAMFTADGIVRSPVLGTMPADAFFATLDDASEKNVLTVHRIMASADRGFLSAHFTYEWTLRQGGKVIFDGIDMFEFDDEDRFVSMSIFYDTHPTRSEVGNKYERPAD